MNVWPILMLLVAASLCQANMPAAEWRNILVSDTLDVFMDGKRTGSLRSSYTVDTSDIVGNVHITIENYGKPLMELIERRKYHLDGNLKSVYQQMKSQSGITTWDLIIDNKDWSCTVVTAGVRTTRKVIPVNEHLRNTYVMYKKIKNRSLKQGDTWIDTIIELTSGDYVINTTTCTDVPSDSNSYRWVLSTVNSLQGKNERWELDTNGYTVYHEVSPFIATRRGISPEIQEGADQIKTDLFETFSVHVGKAPTLRDQIVLQLDTTVFLDESVESMYTRENGKYRLKKQQCDCDESSTKIDDSLNLFLESTATLQKDHPDIVTLEKKLHKGKLSICQRIQEYNSYVYTTIRKQNTATYSSAVETLHAGFGDCGEHSVLLAALLRASGIPARVVLGLVYIDAKKRFLGHAWVMAFTGTTWISADPSHNVFPACTKRIPLLIDDTGQKMIRLIGMIGKINIEIVPEN